MLVLKDVLRPRLKPGSSGGGRVPTRQVPYRQKQFYIQVVHFNTDISNIIYITYYNTVKTSHVTSSIQSQYFIST